MPRGGPRQGRVGKTYANRTDLNPAAPKALPATAAPGQQYGQAKAQLDAQKIAPMASGPLSNTQPIPESTMPPPLVGPAPGTLTDPFGPTQRPDEHFMTGVNAGPGAGSEALASFTPDIGVSALGLLKTLPNPSPQVAMIMQYLEESAANGATY